MDAYDRWASGGEHRNLHVEDHPCGLCGEDHTEGGVTVPVVIPGEGNVEDRRLCVRCCVRAYAALTGDGVNEPDWSDRG